MYGLRNQHNTSHSKVHGANMGPTWVLSAPRWTPCWPHEPCNQGQYHLILPVMSLFGTHSSSLVSTVYTTKYLHIFVLLVLFSFLFGDHSLHVIHLLISFRVAPLALRHLYDHSSARIYYILLDWNNFSHTEVQLIIETRQHPIFNFSHELHCRQVNMDKSSTNLQSCYMFDKNQDGI